jgi:hypothetical protein
LWRIIEQRKYEEQEKLSQKMQVLRITERKSVNGGEISQEIGSVGTKSA